MTVASVTAAPKPSMVCLYPDEVSSMVRLKTCWFDEFPSPWTGAVIGDSMYVRFEFVQYADAVAALFSNKIARLEDRPKR